MTDPINSVSSAPGGNASKPVILEKPIVTKNGDVLIKTNTGKVFTVTELLSYVVSRMIRNVEGQLKIKSAALKKKVAAQKKANDVLQSLLSGKPSDKDKKVALPNKVVAWLRANGEKPPTDQISSSKWDEWVEVVRSKIDTLSSNSETANLELNALTKHLNEYVELESNLTSEVARTSEKIITNTSS